RCRHAWCTEGGTTGIPRWPGCRQWVAEGVLVSRGMFARISPGWVFFPGTGHAPGGTGDAGTRVGHDAGTRVGHDAGASRGEGGAGGLGPSAADHLVLPESWRPFEEPTEVAADVIFWNTGFRAALDHLAPLQLRSGGGIRMKSEVEIEGEERVLRSEEHTSELQSRFDLVCCLLLENKILSGR